MLSNILLSRLLVAMLLYIFESDILALAPFEWEQSMIEEKNQVQSHDQSSN